MGNTEGKNIFSGHIWARIRTHIVFGVFLFALLSSFFYQCLNLIYFTLKDKALILSLPFFILFCGYLFFQHHYPISLPKLSHKTLLFWFTLSLILSVVIILIQKDQIPSWNHLTIKTVGKNSISTNPSTVSIPQIVSILNSESSSVIPEHRIQTSGSCQYGKSGIICQSDEIGEIRFQDFSTKGIILTVDGFSSGGIFIVDFNGSNFDIDTYRITDDQFTVPIPYSFKLHNQSIMRKIELILIAGVNAISMFLIIMFLFFTINNFQRIRFFLKQNLRFVMICLLLVFSIVLNGFLFRDFQNTDLFRLQRNPGNTLIDLDNTSHDNIQNLQVYMNFFKYYVNMDVFISEDQIHKYKINIQRLQSISMVNSMHVLKANPEIHSEDIEALRDIPTITIPPTGRIKYTFKLITEFGSQKDGICAWSMEDTLYFIPITNQFDCRKYQ